MKDLHAQFCDEVRAKMKALGMSHADLAKRLGTTRPRVSELLSKRQRHSPSLKMVGRVTKALNCVAALRLYDKT